MGAATGPRCDIFSAVPSRCIPSRARGRDFPKHLRVEGRPANRRSFLAVTLRTADALRGAPLPGAAPEYGPPPHIIRTAVLLTSRHRCGQSVRQKACGEGIGENATGGRSPWALTRYAAAVRRLPLARDSEPSECAWAAVEELVGRGGDGDDGTFQRWVRVRNVPDFLHGLSPPAGEGVLSRRTCVGAGFGSVGAAVRQDGGTARDLTDVEHRVRKTSAAAGVVGIRIRRPTAGWRRGARSTKAGAPKKKEDAKDDARAGYASPLTGPGARQVGQTGAPPDASRRRIGARYSAAAAVGYRSSPKNVFTRRAGRRRLASRLILGRAARRGLGRSAAPSLRRGGAARRRLASGR
jgi:hypothetical protein